MATPKFSYGLDIKLLRSPANALISLNPEYGFIMVCLLFSFLVISASNAFFSLPASRACFFALEAAPIATAPLIAVLTPATARATPAIAKVLLVILFVISYAKVTQSLFKISNIINIIYII